ELRDGDAISFGGLPGRFERLSAAEAATVEAERLARIETSARIRRRLRAEPEPADLLLRFLEAAMELTRTDRGFVILISPGGKLRAEVASGLSPEAVRDERFRGSVGAVRQAVESRGPIVLSDVRADPRLGKRPSVVSLGIAALACVPLPRTLRRAPTSSTVSSPASSSRSATGSWARSASAGWVSSTRPTTRSSAWTSP